MLNNNSVNLGRFHFNCILVKNQFLNLYYLTEVTLVYVNKGKGI